MLIVTNLLHGEALLLDSLALTGTTSNAVVAEK